MVDPSNERVMPDSNTTVTRPGWIFGPAALILGFLLWAANAVLLVWQGEIYAVSSWICLPLIGSGLFAVLLPGPRIELDEEQAQHPLSAAAEHAGILHLAIWIVGALVGLAIAVNFPASTVFSPLW